MSQSYEIKSTFNIYQKIWIVLQNKFVLESSRKLKSQKKEIVMNCHFKYALALTILSCISLQAAVITLESENQFNAAMKNNKHMIIEFSAEWCSVCNAINKPYAELANDPEFKHITFAQVDVDKLDGVSKKYGIVGVPTFLYIENGDKKVEEIGVQNMPAFKDHIKETIRSNFTVTSNAAAPKNVQSNAITEEVLVDMDAPMSHPAAVEPNIFIKLFGAVKHFIMMIFIKITEFFTTIIDAIKGFFGA